ncbi:unnamed protein product [marine sediment metagenome]|uniref:Glycosyltransferase 2-like domain-containing protein n=1 Tax=marine sediment metagenome TaxID=412755 RepID=X1AN26_9ZZZZ
MVKTPPIVSIVMIMRNQNHWLLECSRRCFKSIKEHTVYPAYELIVVDSESTTKGWRELNKEFIEQGAIVFRSEKNLGFGGSFNSGLNLTSSEYVFFVENDVIVTDFWVTNALRCFGSYLLFYIH